MEHLASKEIAKLLAARAREQRDIPPAEFRRLFVMGLGALLREVDAISYELRNRAKKEEWRG